MKKEAMVGEDGLPPKRREYVSVAVDPTVMKELNAKIREREVRPEKNEITRKGSRAGESSKEALYHRINDKRTITSTDGPSPKSLPLLVALPRRCSRSFSVGGWTRAVRRASTCASRHSPPSSTPSQDSARYHEST